MDSKVAKDIKWRYTTTLLLPNEEVRFVTLCHLTISANIQCTESHSQPVRAIGFQAAQPSYDNQMLPPLLPNVPSGAHDVVLSWPWPARHNYGPAPSQISWLGIDPYIVVCGGWFSHVKPIPDFFANHGHSQSMPGYQESHAMYDKIWTYFANQAYKTQNCKLVVVQVLTMVLKPGQVKEVIIEVCAIDFMQLRISRSL